MSNDNITEKEIIDSLNKDHALAWHNGNCILISEKRNDDTKQVETFLSNMQQLKTWYKDKRLKVTINGNQREKTWAEIWERNADKRKYREIVFNPAINGHDPRTGAYNLYTGLALKPEKGRWDIFQEHILNVICNQSEQLYNFVLDWIAYLVQNPGGPKPGTAIVLKGGKGSGKGKFCTMIGKIFGIHFIHIQGPAQLTNNFNSHFKNKVLVFGDEAVWGGDKKSEGRLKALITEDQIMIEQKYLDPITIDNHLNFIFASNENWAVPTTYDERRFLILEVSDKRQKDFSYFAKIDQVMLEDGGLEAMLFDLLSRKITSNLRDVPRTEALWDEIQNGLTPEEKWYFNFLHEGRLLAENEPIEIEKSKVYSDYEMTCSSTKVRKPVPKTRLGREIRKLCPGITDRKPLVDGKQVWIWIFPSLKECRQRFERVIGWSGDFLWK